MTTLLVADDYANQLMPAAQPAAAQIIRVRGVTTSAQHHEPGTRAVHRLPVLLLTDNRAAAVAIGLARLSK
jgi:hypothetical protein